MRGADAGTPAMMVAQSALWVGLLYDDAALAAAESLLRGFGHQDAVMLRLAVPRHGLAAPIGGRELRELAREVVRIARDGLQARGRVRDGVDESVYLAPLDMIVEGAPSQAETWLARYHGEWRGDVRRILAEAAV